MKRQFAYSLNGINADVYCPETPVSIGIVGEVLNSEAYPIYTFIQGIEHIVDIGAHAGAFAIRMACTFPEAHIHSFEPNPAVYQYLQKNMQDRDQKLTSLHQAAVSDRRGKGLLHVYDDAVYSSLTNVPHMGLETRISVDLYDAADLPEKIDILKIDTEGHEMRILNRLGRRLSAIPYIYLEFHSKEDRLLMDKVLLPTHDLFSGKIIHSGCGEVFYLKRNPPGYG